MKLGVVILAAGQGTRMRSDLPKVLHHLAGRPLLQHVITTARQLSPERIVVVYGHGGEQVREAHPDPDLIWVEQAEQLGTGHAVEQALPQLQSLDRVLVLYGDVPLIGAATLSSLLDAAAGTDLALLTAELDEPDGYGRILRDKKGDVLRIVEQKDASAEELAIREINTGFLVADYGKLTTWIERLENSNAQGEFYLTDIVELAVTEGVEVHAATTAEESEVTGVNDRQQLACLEREYQRQQAEQLMIQGVTLRDPARFDLRGKLTVGRDVEIDVNVILEGEVTLGDGVRIGANNVLRDCHVGAGTLIKENCVLDDAAIGEHCIIGPFARIRPETVLKNRARVGNFVEIKKSEIGEGSKVNHLSYVGDTQMGATVNVGAGTITCNYDGANKHRTIIGDNVFIGSDTQLVAPVEVKPGATIGAGSTITKDAPADTLTLSRSRQVSLNSWTRPVKKKD